MTVIVPYALSPLHWQMENTWSEKAFATNRKELRNGFQRKNICFKRKNFSTKGFSIEKCHLKLHINSEIEREKPIYNT